MDEIAKSNYAAIVRNIKEEFSGDTAVKLAGIAYLLFEISGDLQSQERIVEDLLGMIEDRRLIDTEIRAKLSKG